MHVKVVDQVVRIKAAEVHHRTTTIQYANQAGA